MTVGCYHTTKISEYQFICACMSTLGTCHESRLTSANWMLYHLCNTVYKDYSTFAVSNVLLSTTK